MGEARSAGVGGKTKTHPQNRATCPPRSFPGLSPVHPTHPSKQRAWGPLELPQEPPGTAYWFAKTAICGFSKGRRTTPTNRQGGHYAGAATPSSALLNPRNKAAASGPPGEAQQTVPEPPHKPI